MRFSRPLWAGLLSSLALGVAFLACGDDNIVYEAADGGGFDPIDAATKDSGKDAATRTDAGVLVGPASLDFDPDGKGDPISMVWNDELQTLFIADNTGNQIWTWTDADGFAKLAQIPDDPEATSTNNTSLGQIVRLSDGTLVVPRFGNGKRGAICWVNPDTKDTGCVPNAPLERRRTALTATPDDEMFGGYFAPGSTGPDAGIVTRVDFDGETDYAGGFQKPVGMLVVNGQLIVSEQGRNVLYALPTDGGAVAPYPIYAEIPSPDALTRGPGDSILTGQFKPQTDGGPLQIRQIGSDGTVKVVVPDQTFTKPQGTAYDPTNKRLFVADSNGSTVRTVRIFPLE